MCSRSQLRSGSGIVITALFHTVEGPGGHVEVGTIVLEGARVFLCFFPLYPADLQGQAKGIQTLRNLAYLGEWGAAEQVRKLGTLPLFLCEGVVGDSGPMVLPPPSCQGFHVGQPQPHFLGSVQLAQPGKGAWVRKTRTISEAILLDSSFRSLDPSSFGKPSLGLLGAVSWVQSGG